MEVEVQIERRYLFFQSGQAAIFLKDKKSDAMMYVAIEEFEASAIFREMLNLVAPRPMTHDFIKNLLVDKFKAMVTKVVITELKGNIFHAVVVMDRGGEVLVQDSRPSDAIAIALRFSAPIFVENEIFTEVSRGPQATRIFGLLATHGLSVDEIPPPSL